MPSLDQLLTSPQTEQDAALVEGELVMWSGRPYLRVNDEPELWGPLKGAGSHAEGDELLVGISQTGNYWVVASASPTTRT
jgi:hypothetical protein